MKVVAVIPVHGRLPLLQFTIQRLILKNKVHKVICLGDCEDEAVCCEQAGAQFIWHKNKPIGRKLNAGFRIAKDYNPDAVSFIGSSDWLCDEWFNICEPFLEFDLMGKFDSNMAHISNGSITVIHWTGYKTGTGREIEPIGIGRILTSKVLERLNWQPFDDYLNNSLDYSMYLTLRALKNPVGSCYIYNSPELQSLSVSCDNWSNMHSFTKESNDSILYQKPGTWLKMWFPEIFELKKDLYGM
jgi:hypothetical protein